MSLFQVRGGLGDGWGYALVALVPILIGVLFVFWGPLYGFIGLFTAGAQIKYLSRHRKYNIRPERPVRSDDEDDEDDAPDPSYFR